MKFYLNWLKQYINVDLKPAEIAEKLTLAGLEVGEYKLMGGGIENVLTSEVIKIKKHPNADKLSVCQVSNGREILSVVCGASNIKEKDRVPLAMVGAELPGGLKIKKSKIRGESSSGMLCSGKELGIDDDEEGIYILPGDTPLGRDLCEYLNLKNWSFELEITPNRADLLGMIGIARELGAICQKSIKYPSLPADDSSSKDSHAGVKVEIHDPDLCPRYTAAVVKGVKVGESPDWLKRRLEGAGVRSINNIVDITNFVMIEWGQPLHAFDLSKINGNKIVVRRAKAGEKLKTLDGETRKLEPNDLMICDGSGPVALGGIMGGEDSEISESTADILLESAYFDPKGIRRTSRRLGLTSDSSYRFERGIDPEGARKTLLRAVSLIEQFAKGKWEKGVIDVYPKPYKPNKILLRSDKVTKLLGVSIAPAKIKSILESLEMEVRSYGEVDFEVSVPTFRQDIVVDHDLIEEVARIYGYHLIPVTLPKTLAEPDFFDTQKQSVKKIERVLLGAGFMETRSYSFISPKDNSLFTGSDLEQDGETLKILNPINEDMSVMRQSLLPSLLRNLCHHRARNIEDLKLYEIDKTFHVFNRACSERTVACAVMTGKDFIDRWDYKARAFDFFDIKGIFEEIAEKLNLSDFVLKEGSSKGYLHPKMSMDIFFSEKMVGCFGQLHPDILLHYGMPAVYSLEILLGEVMTHKTCEYEPFSKFPAVERDISMLVPKNVRHADILDAIAKIRNDLIRDIRIFDRYSGKQIPEGKKSLSYRIVYQSNSKTLKEDEVSKIHEKILASLSDEVKAELR